MREMVGVILQFLLIIGLFCLADFFSKVMIARHIKDNPDFFSFLKGMLQQVYAMIVVCFATWFIFGEASFYLIAYCFFVFVHFARLDLDDAQQNYDEARQLILNALND